MAEVCADGVMTCSELRFSCVVKMCLRSSQRETRTITFYDIKARVRGERSKSDPWSSSLAGCEVKSSPPLPFQRWRITLKIEGSYKSNLKEF